MEDANATTLHGHSVLIAEDEALIAMLMEDIVAQLGGTVAGVATTSDEALHILETVPVTFVYLDLHLHGGTSETVLAAADSRGLPVLISSGAREFPEPFRGRPSLLKPWSMEDAGRSLEAMLRPVESKGR